MLKTQICIAFWQNKTETTTFVPEHRFPSHIAANSYSPTDLNADEQLTIRMPFLFLGSVYCSFFLLIQT
ncbi:hypothetical protein L2E82_20969 [Cichorium intybus]|uniref:Uncharacterized protein n=1 Tax=Cichorium intybus TaxID=13427 RepID=A0ACB9DV55_CICIN|nr:hypothetical protein L2E82_20969 [Cichorium intybus]